MKKLSIMLVTLMVFSLFACSDGGNSGGTSDSTPGTNREMHNYPMYDGVDYPIEMWFKPEYNFCPEYDRKEEGTNIKALFLRNDYKGEESYAYHIIEHAQTELEISSSPPLRQQPTQYNITD